MARALDPLVRSVDGLVGEKVAMLVEVEYDSEWGHQAWCPVLLCGFVLTGLESVWVPPHCTC